MRRKTLTWLGAILLCLAALLAVLAARLPDWVDARAREWLAARGVEDYQLGAFQPGLTGAFADRLTIVGQWGEWHVRLILQDLQVDYHWRTLMRGEVRDISVGHLEVALASTETAETKEEPGTPIEAGKLAMEMGALRLPLDRVTIDALEADVLLDDAHWLLSGTDLVLDDTDQSLGGHLRIDGPDTGLPPLLVAVDAAPGGNWLPRLEVRLGEEPESLLHGRIVPELTPDQRLDLAVNARSPLESLAALWPEAPPFPAGIKRLTGTLTLDGRLHLPAAIDPGEPDPLADIALGLELQGEVTAEEALDGALSDLGATGRFRVEGALASLALTLPEPVRLRGRIASLPESLAAALGGAARTPFRLSLSAPQPLALSRGDTVTIAGPTLTAGLAAGSEEKNLSAELALTDLLWKETGALSLNAGMELLLPLDNGNLPVTLDGSLMGDASHWRADGGYGVAPWRARGQWQAEAGAGEPAKISGNLEVADLPAVLETMTAMAPVPAEVDLTSGRATLDYELAFPNGNIEQLYRFELSELAGVYGNTGVSGGHLSGALAGGESWHTPEPLTWRVEQVTTGVSLTDMRGRVALRPGPSLAETTWRAERFSAGLFSGTIELAEPVTFTLPPSGHTVPIRVSDVNLGKVLALYEEQGIGGSGTVRGHIPVTVGADGVSIEDGSLRSDGGHLSYQKGAGEAARSTHQHLDLALQLLEDFAYESLVAEMDFATSGDLILDVHLSGRNPGVFEGRPVNFNINVEENLFDLFKVLQLTDDLTIKLEERLRRQGEGSQRE